MFYADQSGQEYDELLDALFLASGLLKTTPFANSESSLNQPVFGRLSDGSASSLRAGVCLILEEILLTIESGVAKLGDRPSSAAKYFHKEEAHEVDHQEGVAGKPGKGCGGT